MSGFAFYFFWLSTFLLAGGPKIFGTSDHLTDHMYRLVDNIFDLFFRDENRRKREEDLLSDEEFEKEINELGSDDDDDNFDDMDEDDLMMELEQMIDS